MLSLIGICLLLALTRGRGAQWAVQLKPGVNASEFALEHGISPDEMRDMTHVLPGLVMFNAGTVRNRSEKRAIQARLDGDIERVDWAEEQVPRQHILRGAQEDPHYSEQWHLHDETSPACINAHKGHNYSGKNVVIGVVDDGLQHAHPEIQDNYDALHSHNFNGGPNGIHDPSPTDGRDGHGTSAAGVAAARRHNGHCGRGVAYDAKVAGLRLISAPTTDIQEAEALSKYNSRIHIYTNSWGPADTGSGMDRPGRVTRETIARFAGGSKGRHGLGTIYVWAAGNGAYNGDSCAYDGYASNPYVNPIGALNYNGDPSWYSEGCAGLMAVMPSSGAGKGIMTADLMGPQGYAAGECNPSFGGTSSAAPAAAGVIALLLEKNPNLTWRDVKHVIALGATQIKPTDARWHTNKRGYHHHEMFGFGLLKVPPLLEVLDHYDPVPHPQKQFISHKVTRDTRIEDSIAIVFDLSNTTTGITFIENVVVMVDLTHPKRGDVRVSIQSPEGTWSVLGPWRSNDRNANYPTGGWNFNSVHFWGEEVVDGQWTLEFQDLHHAHDGVVKSAQIAIFGF